MSKLYTSFSFPPRRSSFASSFSTPLEWKDASVSAVSFLANSFIISLGELSFLSRLLMIGLMLLLGLSYIISKKVLSSTQRFTYKCPFSHEIVHSRPTFLQVNFDEKDCEAIIQNHDNKTAIFSIVCYSFSASLK